MRKRYVHQRPAHVNTYLNDDSLDERLEEHRRDAPRRLRFGIRGLLMLMMIASIVFAGLGYLLRALRGDGRGFHLAFVLFTLIAPMALLALFSVAHWLQQWTRWPRSGQHPDDGSDTV